MQQLSIESIERALDRVSNFTPEEFLESLQQLDCEQETLNSLITVDYDRYAQKYAEEDCCDYLLFYLIVIYLAFGEQNISLRTINKEEILQDQESFWEMMDAFLETENIELVDEYTGQPNLIRFLLDELSAPDEHGVEIDDEVAVDVFTTLTKFYYFLSKASIS